MDVASAKIESVDLVKVHLMQIPDIQQLDGGKLKNNDAMDNERTLCDRHAVKQMLC